MKDEELSVSYNNSELSGQHKAQICDLVLIASAPSNWANRAFYTSGLIAFPQSSCH